VCSFHKFGKTAKARYNLLSNLYYRKNSFFKAAAEKLNLFVQLLPSES
jgi:hypothetical protein